MLFHFCMPVFIVRPLHAEKRLEGRTLNNWFYGHEHDFVNFSMPSLFRTWPVHSTNKFLNCRDRITTIFYGRWLAWCLAVNWISATGDTFRFRLDLDNWYRKQHRIDQNNANLYHHILRCVISSAHSWKMMVRLSSDDSVCLLSLLCSQPWSFMLLSWLLWSTNVDRWTSFSLVAELGWPIHELTLRRKVG